MVKEDRIAKDMKPLQKYAMAILLYGSAARGESTERSDIDMCVVAPDTDHSKLYREILKISRGKYDIRIFEKMPLFLKIEVIKNHKIIYAKNVYDLYEYFYKFRKIWKDQEHRQKLTKEELRKMF